MGLGSAIGRFFGNTGDDLAGAAGDAGRGAGNAGGAAGGAGRAVGGAGNAGRAAGGAGDAGRAAGGAGDAGRAAGDTPVRQGTPGSPERIKDAQDPNVKDVPSREGGSDWAKNFTAKNAWKATKVVLGVTLVASAVYITARMLDKAKKGADNDGKTYNITSLRNKGSSGKTIICTFKPAIEPNGVVVDDSITFSGTGTSLDGNTYTIKKATSSHSTLEFEGTDRLASEVKNKGSFVLHTSMENQLDNQARELGSGFGSFLNSLFGGIFGFAGEFAGALGVGTIICCICIILAAILFAASK
jgi:hypothetical protein